MSKTLTVAWREFKQTVLRPVFLLAVLGMPVLFIGISILAGVLVSTQEQPPLVGTIGVVDSSGDLSTAVAFEFSSQRLRKDQAEQFQQFTDDATQRAAGGKFDPTAVPDMAPLKRGEISISIDQIEQDPKDVELDALKERVVSEDLLAAVIVPDELLSPDIADGAKQTNPARFDLYVAPDVDNDHVELIERRIGQAIVRVRAERAGLDPDRTLALFDAPGSQTRRMMTSGEESAEGEGVRVAKQLLPGAFMILLWLGVFVAGQHLLMSTIEEKSNRVMEVLLSAVSPLQLMTGKIIGHGGVGLLIIGLYSSAGVAMLAVFTAMNLLDPMLLVYLGIFFLMAYFMIASLMAAVGGAVTDIREANTLITPISLFLIIPWMLWFPITNSPNSTLAVVLTYVPPMTPFVMILRVCADEPIPVTQIVTSIVWGFICMLAMVWMAAKIFRVGVLMYGKPPSPLQLIKWLRYS